MNEKTNRTVIKAKINYPALSQPKSINGSAAKYSGCFIIAKDDVESLNKYQEALEAAYRDGERKLMVGKVMPKLESLRCPLHDGDLEKPGQEAYENSFYLNASSKEHVQVVDRELNPIDPSEIYSGCIVNVSITLYAYNTGVSKGIAAALNGIQLVKKGERIGWGPRIGNDFQVLPDEDDEFECPF